MSESALTLSKSIENTARASHASAWGRELGSRFRKKLDRIAKEEKGRHMGCKSLLDFKKLLVKNYGSIATAWRKGLDPYGHGRLYFSDFSIVVRTNGFVGDEKELWEELVGEEKKGAENVVTLKELDSQTWHSVCALRELFVTRYGSLVDAFHRGLAEDCIWIEEEQFGRKLKEMDFEQSDKIVHKLFTMMVAEKGKRYLYAEDMEALLIGVPTYERSKVWRGHNKPPPPKPLPRQDTMQRSADALKGTLSRKFGSLYAGWWKGLDVNGRGHIPLKQFEKRANAIGFNGNFKALVQKTGKTDGDDSVSLKDIDAEVAARIELFSDLITRRYGSFEAAWNAALDPGNGVLDEKRFKVFCKEIGYESDVHELFKTFLPEVYDSVGERVGRGGLLYEDFGPLAFPPGASDPSSRTKFLKGLDTPTSKDRQPRFLFHGNSSHGRLEPLKSPKSPASPSFVSPQTSPKAKSDVATTASIVDEAPDGARSDVATTVTNAEQVTEGAKSDAGTTAAAVDQAADVTRPDVATTS
jgi:hypothetical protein